MPISVALCTYNGERYVRQQLASIAAQTRMPDELVVFDDASTDSTVHLVEEVRRSAPFDVQVVRNEANRGSTTNFASAIDRCRGDLIVLCDQDDIWHPNKLESLADRLKVNPAAGLVFSDANLVDENLRPTGVTAWQSIGLTNYKRKLITSGEAHRVFLSQYVATGATMMFRAEYRPLLLPIPIDWVHDAWIAFLLAAVAPITLVERPLIDYRQHGGQQIGLRRLGPWGLYQLALKMRALSFSKIHQQFHQSYERLSEYSKCDPRFLQGLERKLEHLDRRDKLRGRGRIGRVPAVVSETLRGNYGRYSYGWKSVLQDLLF